jgi:hypothetical protein
MPEFETYVDVDVDEFWFECSTREKEKLIDMLVDDGWVIRTSPKGTDPESKLPSITDLNWMEMINKLHDIRIQISSDDEESIKQIIKKYRGDYCG